jgi:hypothetical protein
MKFGEIMISSTLERDFGDGGSQSLQQQCLLLLVCHLIFQVHKVAGELVPVVGQQPCKQLTLLAILLATEELSAQYAHSQKDSTQFSRLR